MSLPDDAAVRELLHRAHAGDQDAWRIIVREHDERLRRLARLLLDPRLGARFDPEDVVQETLIDAFQALGKSFEGPLPFREWLDQRLRDRVDHMHRDHRDAQRRSVAREASTPPGRDQEEGVGLVAWLLDPGTSPSGRAMRVEHGRLLQAVLDELGEADREVLERFFFQKLKHAEIGMILNLTPNAVSQRLVRAVAHLKELLRHAHPEWCHAFDPPSQRQA